MSLIEAIPQHMRQSLLEELKQWEKLKEEIEERIDSSREAELAHIRKCLEDGTPLTPLNRSGNEPILRDNETGGELCPEETKAQKTA